MPMASACVQLGIVARRSPGVTRWAKWSWQVTAVVPGAPAASWAVMRQEGEVCEFHVATLPLELWESDTEAYLTALSANEPSVVVVLGEDDASDARMPWRPLLVTASPYEGQDYMDSGEGLVERVLMPSALIAWVQRFCDLHHVETPFVKRRRDHARVDLSEDGKGDARVRQLSDVYRAPARREVTS